MCASYRVVRTGPVCCEPRHRRVQAIDIMNINIHVYGAGVVCRPVSTLKADILNITYDCYSENNDVKMKML